MAATILTAILEFTNGHIYETISLIFMKFEANSYNWNKSKTLEAYSVYEKTCLHESDKIGHKPGLTTMEDGSVVWNFGIRV